MIIKGEKYLVTGGTGVVGYELCKRILDAGSKVLVLSRTKEKLEGLQEKYKEVAESIKSGQVPPDEIVWYFNDEKFYKWYSKNYREEPKNE